VADLLALSARIIDEGITDEPVNRVSGELSEVADGVAVVEAFSHVVAFRTDDGLVLFDTSVAGFGARCRDALRGWSSDRVSTIVYTHGHVDHVGGARFFDDWVRPGTTFEQSLALDVGGTEVELHHERGETDDHLWAWIPSHRAVCAGDFLIWAFPNAGNPQKVQRYPVEWARAMRAMKAMEPELYLPAHGLPIEGRERIAGVLDDVAIALEGLVRDVLHLMNEGARLDDIVHTVRVPAELLAKPYLRPTYDEPEFVVRNIWRLYGGWWDGNPANVKPAADADIAAEVAALAGGAGRLADRARELAATDVRLACHLVEWAVQAAPDDRDVHAARAEVYRLRRSGELSLMSKGIFGTAAAESEARL